MNDPLCHALSAPGRPLRASTAVVRPLRAVSGTKPLRAPPLASPVDGPGGIGTRIRFMRNQRRMTLDGLASSTGLTKSYLSKVERGLSVPSISTTLKVAASFKVSIGQLFGEEPSTDSICVVRRKDRKTFMRHGSPAGYNYQAIATAKPFKSMEPFIMRPPSEFQDGRMFRHTGEEFIFVLQGAMEIQFSRRRITLRAGDAIYFESHLAHRSRSVGDKPAEALVVVKS